MKRMFTSLIVLMIFISLSAQQKPINYSLDYSSLNEAQLELAQLNAEMFKKRGTIISCVGGGIVAFGGLNYLLARIDENNGDFNFYWRFNLDPEHVMSFQKYPVTAGFLVGCFGLWRIWNSNDHLRAIKIVRKGMNAESFLIEPATDGIGLCLRF